MIRRLVFAIVATCFFAGCIMNSTGMSPSSIPITGDDTYTKIGPTSGSSWGMLLYCLPICFSDPMDRAMNEAIRNGGGNALVEMTSDNVTIFLYFVSLYRTRVEGTAVNYVKGGAKIR